MVWPDVPRNLNDAMCKRLLFAKDVSKSKPKIKICKLSNNFTSSNENIYGFVWEYRLLVVLPRWNIARWIGRCGNIKLVGSFSPGIKSTGKYEQIWYKKWSKIWIEDKSAAAAFSDGCFACFEGSCEACMGRGASELPTEMRRTMLWGLVPSWKIHKHPLKLPIRSSNNQPTCSHEVIDCRTIRYSSRTRKPRISLQNKVKPTLRGYLK